MRVKYKFTFGLSCTYFLAPEIVQISSKCRPRKNQNWQQQKNSAHNCSVLASQSCPSLVSSGNGAELFVTAPAVAAAPPLQARLEIHPMLLRRLIPRSPGVDGAEGGDPVEMARHGSAWLVVEMRRDRRGNDGLGSGGLLDG